MSKEQVSICDQIITDLLVNHKDYVPPKEIPPFPEWCKSTQQHMKWCKDCHASNLIHNGKSSTLRKIIWREYNNPN
tara:strand:- start:253 stop:480 length:228 start_codon:yes stop_codon:yes gene_type:complete